MRARLSVAVASKPNVERRQPASKVRKMRQRAKNITATSGRSRREEGRQEVQKEIVRKLFCYRAASQGYPACAMRGRA
jgi:hypothetical protein